MSVVIAIASECFYSAIVRIVGKGEREREGGEGYIREVGGGVSRSSGGFENIVDGCFAQSFL